MKMKLQYFVHLIQRPDSLEKTLMLGNIESGGEGDDRKRDGWMASPTQWTWVWANAGKYWRTGKTASVHGVTKSWTRLATEQPKIKIKMGMNNICCPLCYEWETVLLWTIMSPGLHSHYGASASQPACLPLESCYPLSSSEVRILPQYCFKKNSTFHFILDIISQSLHSHFIHYFYVRFL